MGSKKLYKYRPTSSRLLLFSCNNNNNKYKPCKFIVAKRTLFSVKIKPQIEITDEMAAMWLIKLKQHLYI